MRLGGDSAQRVPGVGERGGRIGGGDESAGCIVLEGEDPAVAPCFRCLAPERVVGIVDDAAVAVGLLHEVADRVVGERARIPFGVRIGQNAPEGIVCPGRRVADRIGQREAIADGDRSYCGHGAHGRTGL